VDVFNDETYGFHVAEPTTRISTTYFMISLPPSFDGGCQCSVIELAVVSLHCGTPGLPGTAAYVEGKAKMNKQISTLH